MDAVSNREVTVQFKNPKRFLGNLDASLAAKVIASATDIALIIDDGIIVDVAVSDQELSREDYGNWRGRAWIDTVTSESRPKIEDMLSGASARSVRWRHVNHPSVRGIDIPVKYTAVKTGNNKTVVALGRDLRGVSALQQRLVEAQQEIEREYSRLRQTEARYQVLFRSIGEAILVVDSGTTRIEEANPAASKLCGDPSESLAGAFLADLFDSKSASVMATAVASALSTGRADVPKIILKNGISCGLLISVFRQENAVRLLVRLASESTSSAAQSGRAELFFALEQLPDGLVIAGPDLRIMAVNRAFLDLVHVPNEQQALGEHVAQYFGRSPTELNVLIANIKAHASVRNFATVLRDRYGKSEDVEISAVIAPHGSDILHAFSVRSVARRLKAGAQIGAALPNTVDRLTGLVGRVSLKDIVRESTDMIEKLCIEAALEVTQDNKASAAEMLGLSRQGLYSKLRRFGMGDLD